MSSQLKKAHVFVFLLLLDLGSGSGVEGSKGMMKNPQRKQTTTKRKENP